MTNSVPPPPPLDESSPSERQLLQDVTVSLVDDRNQSPSHLPPPERVWSKVDKDSIGTGCWIWTAAKSSTGYGNMRFMGRNFGAHRITFELVKGAIPRGLVLDHLCVNPICVNPDHLEAVTDRVNVMRSQSPAIRVFLTNICLNGHDRSGRNIIFINKGRPNETRVCRVCFNANKRRSYHKNKIK